jgi:hypothetical protein
MIRSLGLLNAMFKGSGACGALGSFGLLGLAGCPELGCNELGCAGFEEFDVCGELPVGEEPKGEDELAVEFGPLPVLLPGSGGGG